MTLTHQRAALTLSMRMRPPCSPWSECAFVRAHAAETAQAVLFPMLSGRLWSRDHEAEPAAAMNHCVVEPPLDRREEGEEEAGPALGWREGGGKGKAAGGGKKMDEDADEGAFRYLLAICRPKKKKKRLCIPSFY